MRKGEFFDNLVVAAGLDPATYPTDDEIVERVATLHREAGRPGPPGITLKGDEVPAGRYFTIRHRQAGSIGAVAHVLDPSAASMKAGLDAVEKAMGSEHVRVKVRTTETAAREREALADAIVQAVAELPDRTSPDEWPEAMLVTSEELKRLIIEALADCDDPGAYDRIPGEEGEDEAAPWDESAWPTQPADPRTERQRPTTPKADPAFPGEVALRDDPAWRAPGDDGFTAAVKARVAAYAGVDPSEVGGEAFKGEWWKGRPEKETAPKPILDGRYTSPTPAPPVYDQRAAQPAPDLLKAAEDVLKHYGSTEYLALAAAVEAEKKRQGESRMKSGSLVWVVAGQAYELTGTGMLVRGAGEMERSEAASDLAIEAIHVLVEAWRSRGDRIDQLERKVRNTLSTDAANALLSTLV